ncbi:hypothetical protein DS62_09745 [Smithella sp. SC_K08D17]|nr:hypothetical protein DS62_09745 [Smithella sp. SC_K08D17]
MSMKSLRNKISVSGDLYRDGKRQENGEALSPGPTFKEIPASHQRPGYPSYDKKSDDYAT